MAEKRLRKRDWEALIPRPPGGETQVLDEIEDLLWEEGFTEQERTTLSSGFLNRSGSKEVIRVTLRDLEAEFAAQESGPRVLVSWTFYYRPTFADRHLPNLGRTLVSDEEELEIVAFTNHTLAVAQTVSTNLALEQGAEPETLPASGELGPL